MIRPTAIARRYAHAAFEVARETGDPQVWLDQLERLGQAASDSGFRQALRNPNITDDQKVGALENVIPDLKPEVANLIRLLVARRRADILPALAEAFREDLDQFLGRTHAEVVAARPLSSEEMALIQERLRAMTGQSVELRPAVDSSLIGGVIIRLGDQLVDASVATRLERLRQSLA